MVEHGVKKIAGAVDWQELEGTDWQSDR
jgi:hypothetical protein